jgi:subtilase family serine protease
MIKSYHVAAAALTAVIALTACGGGSSVTPNSGATLPTVTPPAYTGPQSLANFTYGANALQGATYVGPANVGTLGVDVSLQLQNASGLEQYANKVNDPHSSLYRHFLTPQEIGQQFGASTANVTAAANYFASYKLHVGTWPQHLSLFVAGSQHELEQAFGTKFGVYRQGSSTFIAPSTAPHFAKTLPVVGVTRLVSAQRSFTNHLSLGGGSVTTSGYTPQQIRNAFDYTGAYKAGFDGSGINVGIVGTGPISSADVPAYGAMFNTNVATVTQVNATDQGVAAAGVPNTVGYPTTGLSTPPPVTATSCQAPADSPANLPQCNAEDVEAQLDTETVASLAPGSNVLFYLAYSASNCVDFSAGTITSPPCTGGQVVYPLIGIALADDEIQQAIADNKVDILSLSYGGPEVVQSSYEFDPTTLQGMGPSEFAALASEGVAVFVSSGDSGAEGCQRPAFQPDIDQACVSYPASDPNVVSVGGVTAPLDRLGNLTNQITGWGLMTDRGHGGSGGGISAYFPQTLTPWQQGIPGVQSSNRNQPDVSLLGDNFTGAAVLLNAAFAEQVRSVGGTSVAAPQMAAMWALVLQACKQSTTCAHAQGAKPYRLGDPASILYGLYATPNTSTVLPTYGQTFYDVLYGNNQQISRAPSPGASPLDPGYNAGPGYDLVTGLGVPFARALIKAVTNQ